MISPEDSKEKTGEYLEVLTKYTNEVAKFIWEKIHEKLSQVVPREVDQADFNLIFTGVCVGLFAHYNAILVSEGLESAEFGEKQALENFSYWYKAGYPDLLKQVTDRKKEESKHDH